METVCFNNRHVNVRLQKYKLCMSVGISFLHFQQKIKARKGLIYIYIYTFILHFITITDRDLRCEDSCKLSIPFGTTFKLTTWPCKTTEVIFFRSTKCWQTCQTNSKVNFTIINALTRQVSPVRRRIRQLASTSHSINHQQKQAKSIPLVKTVMPICQSSGSIWQQHFKYGTRRKHGANYFRGFRTWGSFSEMNLS